MNKGCLTIIIIIIIFGLFNTMSDENQMVGYLIMIIALILGVRWLLSKME